MNIVCGVIEMLSARLSVDGEPGALSCTATGTRRPRRLLHSARPDHPLWVTRSHTDLP
jgi:hypothetical protein